MAGPNGSGKSTLAARVLGPATGLAFVNADLMAAERWPGEEMSHAYEASRLAAEERERLLGSSRSFITGTVFSHRSKVELVGDAAERGYLVHLHVVMIPVELCVARVAERVLDGGHAVPDEKVRERNARLWPLVVEARGLAHRTTFYDNTLARSPLRVVAEYEHHTPVGAPRWPTWTPEPLLRALDGPPTPQP